MMHSMMWLLLFIPYCLKPCYAMEQMTLPDQKTSLGRSLENSLSGSSMNHDLLLDALASISDEAFDAKWPLLSCNECLPLHLRIKCNSKRSVSDSKSATDADLAKRESKLKKVRFFSWGGKRSGNDELYNNYYPDGFDLSNNIYDPTELEYGQESVKRAQPGQKMKVPFNSWGGKRKDQLKKVRFFSWGGKRSPEILVKPRKAAKVPFFSWGGKRSFMPEESDYIEM